MTEQDVFEAAKHLTTTDRGRKALIMLRDWFIAGGLGLDAKNKESILTLIEAAWGPYPGTTLDAIRDEIEQTRLQHA